jgi:CRP/FNR family transcriptional regulator, nitrogen oxide reductase regulator
MPLDRSLVSGLPAFAGLSGEDVDAVLATARSSRFPKDSEVFSQDEAAGQFFLLLSGHIRVVRTTPEGEQIIARYINEGELFGIAIAMRQVTYPATAVAAVDCVVLCWPNAFGANAYQTIGARLQDTQSRVVEMSTRQVEQRIAGAVMRLVQQSGRKTEEGVEIDFPITRQDIAEMTGSTLHTVSRLMSAWEDEGIVKSGRQKVTVTDPHALMLVAENRRKK